MASLHRSSKVDAIWQYEIFVHVSYSLEFSYHFQFPSVLRSQSLNFVQSFILLFTMARIKQATPLRRDPSSEYFSKGDVLGTPSRSPRNLDRESNGIAELNGTANGIIKTLAPKAQKEAGALQFLIAVGGIYGSL